MVVSLSNPISAMMLWIALCKQWITVMMVSVVMVVSQMSMSVMVSSLLLVTCMVVVSEVVVHVHCVVCCTLSVHSCSREQSRLSFVLCGGLLSVVVISVLSSLVSIVVSVVVASIGYCEVM